MRIKNSGRRKRIVLLRLNLILALAAAACLIGIVLLGQLLDTQREAERWQGDNEMAFSQVSCFLPLDGEIRLEDVYTFRYAMLQRFRDAALDTDADPMRLFRDAWSTEGKVVAATGLGRGDANAVAVGGAFFDFHPIQLLNGNYLTEDDLMKDRVLLDEDLAWLLFGGTDLQGLEMQINGKPFVVAGVIRREDDFASEKAYTAGMGLFMSYDAYKELKEDAGISCYEVAMAQPVKNFAVNFVREKFPIGNGEILQNTDRFHPVRLLGLLRQFGTRSMQHHGILYPYWENAARCVEDWCTLLLMLAMLFAASPLICAIVWLIRLFRRARDRVEEDWIPAAKDKAEEAIRVRQRRRWEKKHGMHEG